MVAAIIVRHTKQTKKATNKATTTKCSEPNLQTWRSNLSGTYLYLYLHRCLTFASFFHTGYCNALRLLVFITFLTMGEVSYSTYHSARTVSFVVVTCLSCVKASPARQAAPLTLSKNLSFPLHFVLLRIFLFLIHRTKTTKRNQRNENNNNNNTVVTEITT